MSHLLKQLSELLDPICHHASQILDKSNQLTVDGSNVYADFQQDFTKLFNFQKEKR